VRFLVDMPLSMTLAQWLVAVGHDAIHASAIGLTRAADSEIMARAAADDRIVITADLDYPRLLALGAADRPAVILFRNGDWSESQVIERLKIALAIVPEAELSSSLVVIERARIRRRALPLR
jgi:predicted nuclease of predicted toxin-antitoxin system